MAEISCSSSDFSEGRSCGSGEFGQSDAELGSVAVTASDSWASVPSGTSASSSFPNNYTKSSSYMKVLNTNIKK